MDKPIQFDLQLFAEGEETQVIESVEAVDTSVENTTSTEVEQTETQEKQPLFTMKYNKEEVPIYDVDTAVELAQKGMNYDKIYSQLEQLQNNPGLSLVQKQAERYGMTVEQYVQAVEEAEYQEALNDLIQQNIPEEMAREIMESKKFREQYEKEQQSKADEEKRNADYQAFLSAFPDVKADEIPASVWEDVNSGKSLVDAYTRYENQLLKEQVEKLTQSIETRDKNIQNAQSSTGSVTGQGSATDTFFTREQVQSMSVEEVNRHWDAIMKSQKHWK